MTLRQISKVLLWPRDDEGKMVPAPRPDEEVFTYQDRFFAKFRAWRFPEHQIQVKWRDYVMQNQREAGDGG